MIAPIAVLGGVGDVALLVGFGAIEDARRSSGAAAHASPSATRASRRSPSSGRWVENSATMSISPRSRASSSTPAAIARTLGSRSEIARGREEPRHELAVPAVAGLVAADEDVVALVVALDGHAVPGDEGRRVEVRVEHVVEARERPEPDLVVVVHGRFVAQPPVHRVRVGLDVAGERVVLHERVPLGGIVCRYHRTSLAGVSAVASQSSIERRADALSSLGRARARRSTRGRSTPAPRRRGPSRVRATSYSSRSTGPNSNGSSPLRLHRIPAARSWGSGCSASRRVDRQQQVRRRAHVEDDVGVGQAGDQLGGPRSRGRRAAGGREPACRARRAPTPVLRARPRAGPTAGRPPWRRRTRRRRARAVRWPRRWRDRRTRRRARCGSAAMRAWSTAIGGIDRAVGGEHQPDARRRACLGRSGGGVEDHVDDVLVGAEAVAVVGGVERRLDPAPRRRARCLPRPRRPAGRSPPGSGAPRTRPGRCRRTR